MFTSIYNVQTQRFIRQEIAGSIWILSMACMNYFLPTSNRRRSQRPDTDPQIYTPTSPPHPSSLTHHFIRPSTQLQNKFIHNSPSTAMKHHSINLPGQFSQAGFQCLQLSSTARGYKPCGSMTSHRMVYLWTDVNHQVGHAIVIEQSVFFFKTRNVRQPM